MSSKLLTNQIIMLAFAVILMGCERELDFKYNIIPPQLVAEGVLDETGCSVKLTLTTPMGEPIDNNPVTDAEVTVTDLTDNSSLVLFPESSGTFVCSKSGIPGHEYRLTVMRNGCNHISETVMQSGVNIERVEVSWIKMPYDYVALVQVSIEDPSAYGNLYWVRLYRNGEFYKWALTDDSTSEDGILLSTFMTSRENLDKEEESDALREGDVITATVTPVTRSLFEYLTAISNDSSGPRLFTGDGCLGYFLAAPTASESIIFTSRIQNAE